MPKPIDTTSSAIYDEPGSWGRLSEGWPSTDQYVEAKYALCGRGRFLPYGSYVLFGEARGKKVLRVATEEQLKDLNDSFEVLYRIFMESNQ